MTAQSKILSLVILFCWAKPAFAQRSYTSSSVLASGNWYKISVDKAGVYQLSVPFLNSIGFTGSIPSSQLRLFGNGGAMLPETNAAVRTDDLQEVALHIEDGGDGVLNGNDYVLFYASGPDKWIADSMNRAFSHQKNLYSKKSYYFISVGGAGKRVARQNTVPGPGVAVTSFDERYFYELDSVNFLSSGKEWLGEEFSNLPGRSLSKIFSLPLLDLQAGAARVRISVAARSINTPSVFNVSVNGQQVMQVSVPGVTANQYDMFAQQRSLEASVVSGSSTAVVGIGYQQGSFNSQGWLNWLEFFSRRSLQMPATKQLLFRDWNSTGNNTADFIISNTDAATQVWDVTDEANPLQMQVGFAANQTRFMNDAQRLKEYVAFSNLFLSPAGEGKITNQNLHGANESDYIIITHPLFKAEAERLATFHRQRNNLRCVVVTTEQVFNEFASGAGDPIAIRDFVKMYFDKFRTSWSHSGKYLLLMGKGSFDYKNRVSNNTNYVPVYESANSLDPLATYTSDDFFGFLEDHEDINSNLVLNTLDIGVGRIPATTPEQAKNFVDKLIRYHTAEAMGAWRNELNFVADDEDQNLHLQDAEVLTATVQATDSVFNLQKIYLDAFLQESGSAGGRYPQANLAITNEINSGTLIWNYSGHGGPDRLAEEVILDQSTVNGWQNKNRLPLFITATCDFAPYDNPYVYSLGENLLVRPSTGAIALMTTSRVVFAFSNRIMNDNYLRIALQRDSAGRYKSLGESLLSAKNFTYQNFSDIINNRKFSLLGDPAMTLAFPTKQVVLTAVNNRNISALPDTLKATDLVTLSGEVRDYKSQLISDFNGLATVTVFDKKNFVTTLANDPGSIPYTYSEQSKVLFRGKATVSNGKFTVDFRMPRDVNYQFGSGKISLYAANGSIDGNGSFSHFLVGGTGNNAINDKEGPEIKAFLNDENFVSGGIANASPLLIVRLADSSGINSGGIGIGHDIIATLDGDNRQYFILNNFFESAVDDYKKGLIRFQLPALAPGPHSLHIKAWDAVNNSGEYVLNFIVADDEKLTINHVLNYPNPFTTRTAFWFEHNLPATNLAVKVEIFTVGGKLIKTINHTINTIGNRSSEIEWNGADDYGARVGRGVYLYRLRVTAPDRKSAEKWERLVILQ